MTKPVFMLPCTRWAVIDKQGRCVRVFDELTTSAAAQAAAEKYATSSERVALIRCMEENSVTSLPNMSTSPSARARGNGPLSKHKPQLYTVSEPTRCIEAPSSLPALRQDRRDKTVSLLPKVHKPNGEVSALRKRHTPERTTTPRRGRAGTAAPKKR
jgi:hypothetical protein